MEKQGKKRLSRDQRVSFICTANKWGNRRNNKNCCLFLISKFTIWFLFTFHLQHQYRRTGHTATEKVGFSFDFSAPSWWLFLSYYCRNVLVNKFYTFFTPCFLCALGALNTFQHTALWYFQVKRQNSKCVCESQAWAVHKEPSPAEDPAVQTLHWELSAPHCLLHYHIWHHSWCGARKMLLWVQFYFHCMSCWCFMVTLPDY